jgi:signal transduction histidine kinase
MVSSVIEQIDALTSIANEFSNFAKMPVENKEVINLKTIIEHVVHLFEQENDIDFNVQLPSEIVILGDKELCLRVFNNLIKNAIQAIPDGKKGNIQITCERTNNHFHINICDNGKGIPTEILDKIFVPNFTTKSTGTGLGLAMVKQIIVLHQGEIEFETELNVGTCFHIKLPVYKS